jgi:pimeloyl-ACP methyl ester carboxylesterase
MAADLHRMLGAAGIAPPYILAGHSLGGIIARRFITHYPGEVGGLLVIDSSHEDQMHQFAAEDWREGSVAARQALRRQARILGARRLAALLGLLRHLDAEVAREAPPEFADPARAIILSTRQRRTVVRELLMFSRLQGQSPDLGSLPLTVLTSAKGDRTWRGWPAWTRMQTELAALSSDSRHIHASKAGHYIHLDEPELVIQAVKYLLSRSG